MVLRFPKTFDYHFYSFIRIGMGFKIPESWLCMCAFEFAWTIYDTEKFDICGGDFSPAIAYWTMRTNSF